MLMDLSALQTYVSHHVVEMVCVILTLNSVTVFLSTLGPLVMKVNFYLLSMMMILLCKIIINHNGNLVYKSKTYVCVLCFTVLDVEPL